MQAWITAVSAMLVTAILVATMLTVMSPAAENEIADDDARGLLQTLDAEEPETTNASSLLVNGSGGRRVGGLHGSSWRLQPEKGAAADDNASQYHQPHHHHHHHNQKTGKYWLDRNATDRSESTVEAGAPRTTVRATALPGSKRTRPAAVVTVTTIANSSAAAKINSTSTSSTTAGITTTIPTTVGVASKSPLFVASGNSPGLNVAYKGKAAANPTMAYHGNELWFYMRFVVSNKSMGLCPNGSLFNLFPCPPNTIRGITYVVRCPLTPDYKCRWVGWGVGQGGGRKGIA
jgi:hypothetical protein